MAGKLIDSGRFYSADFKGAICIFVLARCVGKGRGGEKEEGRGISGCRC